MSHFFDGMAGLLNELFGDPVQITRANGVVGTIQGVFRRDPIEVAGDDGFPVLIMSPTLKVPQTIRLEFGDLVEPSIAPGARFVVKSGEPSPSPSADRMVVYELELEP
ncbi:MULTISPECIES: head-tail joining protein [Phaeobacter]|uniref:Phage protein n=1 Tax=Phaeobacter porticola TaxID=1844006 RepID=A0A1L3I0P4_9RHOB|nr:MULTISPECIES: hypothetical protein [Phaeobacter]APG45691.1 hypothetical protein PhaeoP97_00239 [Phaeobacter porticola]AUR38353.1 hypothetical protein PhaeoP18_04137 [Phaeobacter piscinae]